MTDSSRGAVIIAGGAGRRLGGADKPALVVGGRTLLATAVDACSECGEVVVVGPQRPTERAVRWTIEDPPGGGPLAALVAGMRELSEHVSSVVVLAADLPLVSAPLLARLHAHLESSNDADAALFTDAGGRPQPLAAIYRTAPLIRALDAVGEHRDRPVRTVLPRLRVVTLVDPRAADDIDTVADLARWSEQQHSDTRKDQGS